jgi:hypothetical protein
MPTPVPLMKQLAYTYPSQLWMQYRTSGSIGPVEREDGRPRQPGTHVLCVNVRPGRLLRSRASSAAVCAVVCSLHACVATHHQRGISGLAGKQKRAPLDTQQYSHAAPHPTQSVEKSNQANRTSEMPRPAKRGQCPAGTPTTARLHAAVRQEGPSSSSNPATRMAASAPSGPPRGNGAATLAIMQRSDYRQSLNNTHSSYSATRLSPSHE